MTIDHKTRWPWKVIFPNGWIYRFRRRPAAVDKGTGKPAFSMGYRGFAKRFDRVRLR